MLCRILCSFVFFSLSLIFTAHGQSIQSGAASAPTNFGTDLNLSEDPDALMKIPATSLRDSGGPASYSGLSVRGARAKEVTVSLEGIPLNSSSSGDFDMGSLSPFGLENARLLRGGYSPLSTSPNGNLLLQLPREERTRLTLGGGDFDSVFLGLQIPNATFSFDQSENDFPYEKNGTPSVRKDNAHRRYNLRTWYRKDSWQVWAQLLYVDLELPGDINYPMPPSRSQTLRPTAAFQFRSGAWTGDLRADFQRQGLKGESTNYWYAGGGKLSYRNKLSENLSWETSLDQSVDKLSSSDFSSDLRSTSAIVAGLLWSPATGQLIHPSLRMDAITDLDQKFAVHPGIGGRHEILPSVSILWNFAYIQRAPTFNEVYFEIPNFYLPNPDLDREQSLQGDVGYEWIGPSGLFLKQAFYINNKENLIESVDVGPGLYQAKNVGHSLTWGIESSVQLPLRENFEIRGNYTFQRSRVGDHDQREALYQPAHRASVEPIFFPNHFVSVGMPLYMRSSVLATTMGDRVNPQWDLGLNFKTQAVPRIFPFEVRLRIRNLLGWDREETLGYPLSNEASVHGSLTYNF